MRQKKIGSGQGDTPESPTGISTSNGYADNPYIIKMSMVIVAILI